MSSEFIISVAAVIKELRKRNHLTQEQLASAAGLDRTYISGVERGDRNITLGSLEKIVCALDVPLHVFVMLVSQHLENGG